MQTRLIIPALVGALVTVFGPALPGMAHAQDPSPEAKAVMHAFVTCIYNRAPDMDDHTSDASTVGSAVLALCWNEWDKSKTVIWRDASAHMGLSRPMNEDEDMAYDKLGATMATGIVLQLRAARPVSQTAQQ